jgi:hypothetical protein
MTRWQGQQRRRRRQTLRRNLARHGDTATLTPPPSQDLTDPPSDVDLLRAEVRRLGRDLRTARDQKTGKGTLRPSQFLARLLAASGQRRGLLALCDSRPRAFRVDYQRGFRPGDEARVDVMALAMLDAIDLRHTQVRMGAAVFSEGEGHPMGAVTAIPIIVNGRLIAAVALEDPSRHRPLSPSALERVIECATLLGPALDRCLRERARRRWGA